MKLPFPEQRAAHNDIAVDVLLLSNLLTLLKPLIVSVGLNERFYWSIHQELNRKVNTGFLFVFQRLLLVQDQAPLRVTLSSNLTKFPQIFSLVTDNTFDLFPPCKSLPTIMVPA